MLNTPIVLLEGRDSNPRTLTRTDLQSVAFNHSATLQFNIVDCPSQFNSGFELNQLSYDICASPRTRTLTKWVGTIYASHYTNDANNEIVMIFIRNPVGSYVSTSHTVRELGCYINTIKIEYLSLVYTLVTRLSTSNHLHLFTISLRTERDSNPRIMDLQSTPLNHSGISPI